MKGEPAGDVWFVYDGDCPICATAARAFRIRKDVGRLHLVNARLDAGHPLAKKIDALGLDLDEGMVLEFGGTCYHGADALHMMALLGSGQGWFNRMNARLFGSKRTAKLAYPAMRAARNLAIRLKGVPQIGNTRRR